MRVAQTSKTVAIDGDLSDEAYRKVGALNNGTRKMKLGDDGVN